MKRMFLLFIVTALLFTFVGCNKNTDDEINSNPNAVLNSVNLSEYTIIYSESDYDYSKRAAEYIQSEISNRTSLALPIRKDTDEDIYEYEIVVGETSREISSRLNADTEGLEFSILAEEKEIALEGDYFIIAAAAYYFVDTYIVGYEFSSNVPKEVQIHEPITKNAKNYILLIGDGMGENHTRLYEQMQIPENQNFSDNENIFYGYLLPSHAYARTESLSGVTDSAAAGTALSSGYKTLNGNIGRDKDLNDVKLITELASSLGVSSAVMSTEGQTGATPAAFSAHADNRGSSALIRQSQKELSRNYGTIINCGYDFYTKDRIPDIERVVNSVLDTLDNNEKGFFMMYEEAHIDKHSHNNDKENTFLALVRFNQIIAVFMEYAFYNPETFILITADHETGKLLPNEDGEFEYNSEEHTDLAVPIFAYGKGSELFDGKTVENTQIPKTIANLFGADNFGDPETAGALE